MHAVYICVEGKFNYLINLLKKNSLSRQICKQQMLKGTFALVL